MNVTKSLHIHLYLNAIVYMKVTNKFYVSFYISYVRDGKLIRTELEL